MKAGGEDQGISQEAGRLRLDRLVAALPEIYQPIFGHPDLSAHVTRGCEDRLVRIMEIYRALESCLNRPLRVLDLGCAQGFFSLSLAKWGAVVHGVDLQECNVAVCKALAAEHPDLKVTFHKGLIEEVILTIKEGQYDLVLGLSVFHHLVHILGVTIVQTMFVILSQATLAGIFELALADEPTERALSQPEDPRQLLNAYAFTHEIARHSTHLNNSRPMYVASNRYWFLNGQAQAFETWKTESHELSKGSNNGTRRYFFGNGLVVKLFRLDDEKFHDINLQEHANAIRFLSRPPAGFKAPQLVLYGQHQREAWLVCGRWEGELLLDKIRQKKPYDARIILRDILAQLALLEAAGFYHDDLRTWNILVQPDGRAALIDYGAIAEDGKDRGWPYNIFLSFMIFMHEVVSGDLAIPDPIRPTFFNPDSFPEPYHSILWKFLECAPDQWSFAYLRDSFAQPSPSRVSEESRQSFSMILQIMESACKIHQSSARYWRRNAGQANVSAERDADG